MPLIPSVPDRPEISKEGPTFPVQRRPLIDRLSISYSRSSGPGGQHVNKVNTKAEVRFNLSSADWIPENVRQKISVQVRHHVCHFRKCDASFIR
ncbi:hypothetical protein FKM82_031203 [Ascaphus truei]